jgi:ABC-type glycerol-3-phosphate transport system substrate-binding protein
LYSLSDGGILGERFSPGASAMRTLAILVAILVATFASAFETSAMTMEACGAKFRAEKESGSGAAKMGWNAFRLSRCRGEELAAATSAAPEPAVLVAAASTGDGSGAVFPKEVDPQFGKETPTKARFKTCVAQYRVNKASSGNAGLKWVQKGGGYYSACNKRLKSAKST